LTIQDAQQQVDEWIKTVGIRYYNELTNTAILMEEVGEVARLMARMYGEQSFKRPEDEINAKENLGGEMADVLFVLICLANQSGIDLDKELVKSMAKKTKRDTERHKNNTKINPSPTSPKSD